MIRQPTAGEIAYGAMLFGFLLLGIVLGVWLGGHDNTREWIGAISGWAAAVVAIPLGVLAWIAVHKQMDQAKDLHRKKAQQAEKVVAPYVRQLAEITNNLIADASEIMGSGLEITLRLNLIKQGLDAIDRMKFSDVFERFENELPPDKSFFLNEIIVALREVSDAFANLKEIYRSDEGNLKGAATHASALAQRLAERIGMFEPECATEFTSLPEHLVSDNYEQAPMRSYRHVRRALINTYVLKE
ncbi:hypothetical protein IWQ54_001114 [Labrenzia sp. EL_195]|nr:hypothetical protein [Labrenzia sp. EL_195]